MKLIETRGAPLGFVPPPKGEIEPGAAIEITIEEISPDVSTFSASTEPHAGAPEPGKTQRSYVLRPLIPFMIPIAAAPLSYLLGLLLSLFPNSVELIYSRFLYQFGMMESLLIGSVPLSVGEILLPLAVIALCVWLLVSLARSRRRPMRLVACVLGILSIVSVCGAHFTLCWGLNYQRATVAQMLRLNVRERPIEELEQLVARLALEANMCREFLPEDRFGIFDPGDDDAIFQSASEACSMLGAQFPSFDRPFPKAKGLLSSELFSRLGISGVYNPITSEANVNVDEPKLLRAAAACHELSHMAGFAREDEANFLAFYATRQSKSLHVRYSGTVLALLHAENTLYDRDPDAFDSVRQFYSQKLDRDLANHGAYWTSKKGLAQETMSEVNDTYLKAHGTKDGIQSYGRMIDLLLAFYEGKL